jgi:CubicO group peptidase (beta-lactamase class C family)
MSNAHWSPGFERLHQALAARISRNEVPGLVALVARGDEVYVDVLGQKALDDAEPMRRETIFRIASMTKPIVAAAALMLVEDGTLGLDEPVDRWLPELAQPRVLRALEGPLTETVPARRSVTVDDLLTNRLGTGLLVEPTYNPPFPIVQAGLEQQLTLAEPEPRTPHAPDEWMRRFAGLPLMYQPGERWMYNVSSLVLGVLVARAASQDLGDLLQSRLFEPLGMQHTGFWLPAELTRELPSYYMTNQQTGVLERLDQSPPSLWSQPPVFPSAAGGLLSTADDYLRFGQMLLHKGRAGDRQLLAPASVERMTTNQLTPEQVATAGPLLGAGKGWGFGVAVTLEPDEAWPVPGRYGWAGGYGSVWINDPHRQITAVLLTQVSDVLWNGTLDEFDRLVAEIFSLPTPAASSAAAHDRETTPLPSTRASGLIEVRHAPRLPAAA